MCVPIYYYYYTECWSDKHRGDCWCLPTRGWEGSACCPLVWACCPVFCLATELTEWCFTAPRVKGWVADYAANKK